MDTKIALIGVWKDLQIHIRIWNQKLREDKIADVNQARPGAPCRCVGLTRRPYKVYFAMKSMPRAINSP